MERKKKDTEHVKSGHIVILKSVHHHGKNVVVPEGISFQQAKAGVSYPHREMREMINDKCEHNQSAHHHMTRCKRCFDVTLVDVRVRSGTPIFNCQLDGHVDMNNDGGEQKNSDQPKQRSKIVQMLRVTIDPARTDENLQISKQMSDHKKDQNDAGDRDDYFFSDR